MGRGVARLGGGEGRVDVQRVTLWLLGYDPPKRGRSERCSQRRKQRLAHANAAFNGASSVRFTQTLLSASQAVFTSSERRALVAFETRDSDTRVPLCALVYCRYKALRPRAAASLSNEPFGL